MVATGPIRLSDRTDPTDRTPQETTDHRPKLEICPAMEQLFGVISILVYGALGLIALWGAYCVILAWRRLSQTRFRSEKQQAEFLDELDQKFNEGGVQASIELCRDDRRAVPQLSLYALTNRHLEDAKLHQQVTERFQRDVLGDLEYRLSWITTIIKSAPMVGLLGTVIGMMGAFAKLDTGASIDKTNLAQDISFALITTACGLAIAIPLVMCTASINIRIRQLEDLVSSSLIRLFEMLKSK